jgi:hypothetical protein
MSETVHIVWKCPKCGAKPDEHGKGGRDRCKYTGGGPGGCVGFLCECEDEERNSMKGHGDSFDNRCLEANCYHCGWGGEFPPVLRKLKPWEKLALAAGWKPPAGWRAG